MPDRLSRACASRGLRLSIGMFMLCAGLIQSPYARAADSPPSRGLSAQTSTASVARGVDRIAIVAPAHDRLSAAIAAELQALGFATSWRPRPDAFSIDGSALIVVARQESALAAVRARVTDGHVQVWIADRVTNKTVLRVVAPAGDAMDLEALALRTVELLRASLLEASLPDAAPGEVPITAEIERKAKFVRPRSKFAPPERAVAPELSQPGFRLSIAPRLSWSPGGLSLAGGLDLGLGWMLNDRWGAVLFTSVSLLDGAVERGAGRATLDTTVAGAKVRLQPLGRAYRWVPSVALGFAAVSVTSRAEATAPLQAQRVSAWTAAPQAEVGIAYRINSRVRLRADAGAGLLLAPVSLRFAGEEVATWGRPFVFVALGADVGWYY